MDVYIDFYFLLSLSMVNPPQPDSYLDADEEDSHKIGQKMSKK
jgi:hypothetical protein